VGETPEKTRKCPQVGAATPQSSLAVVFLRPKCPALLPSAHKRRQHQGEYPNARRFWGRRRGPYGHCVAGGQCGAANKLPTASAPRSSAAVTAEVRRQYRKNMHSPLWEVRVEHRHSSKMPCIAALTSGNNMEQRAQKARHYLACPGDRLCSPCRRRAGRPWYGSNSA